MFRKVLVIHKKNEQEKQIFGLLSLQSSETLKGKLKVFEEVRYDSLLIKIGENILVFNSIKNKQEFDFETVFHELDLPICAILTDGAHIVAAAKSEGCEIDEQSLLKGLNGAGQVLAAQNEKPEEMKDKTDLKEKIENTDNFLEMIKPQLDALFSQNEHFKELEESLEGTEWVKVNCNEDGFDHYILGKLYDGGVVTHIAYGTYAENQKQSPPQGLEQYCQFLPLDPQDENSAGYYVMYQDAITGENVIL